MARFDRLEVYQTIFSDGIVPLFFNKDREVAKLVTEALYKGGGRILEFTNRGEGALEIFSYITGVSQTSFPEMVIGAGTVIDAQTAASFISNGANFIVGPNFDEGVARLCNRNRIPYIPGVATVNEMVRAEEFGAEIVKIFPGSTIGGPKFVKALLGPFPRSKVMPTGGVTIDEENIKEWFDAGVVCIGIGSDLISKRSMQEKNYKEITERMKKALKIVDKVRNG